MSGISRKTLLFMEEEANMVHIIKLDGENKHGREITKFVVKNIMSKMVQINIRVFSSITWTTTPCFKECVSCCWNQLFLCIASARSGLLSSGCCIRCTGVFWEIAITSGELVSSYFITIWAVSGATCGRRHITSRIVVPFLFKIKNVKLHVNKEVCKVWTE